MPEALPVWTVLLVLCLSYVCSDALQIPSEDRRLTLVYRRGDVSGLFPFPRVGRSQVSHSEDPFGQRSLGSQVSKRQGLIPFPRVGKRQQHQLPLPFLFGSRVPSDAFYDEFAQGRPVKGAALAAPPVSEEDPWDAVSAEEGKRSAEWPGAGQEGMWFGPRLGRRRRRSAGASEGGPAGGKKDKHRPGPFWGDDAGRGSTGEYVEQRRPDFHSILRTKELLLANPSIGADVEDEDTGMLPEDTEFLYGDATVETPGVELREEEEESSPMAGRRRRRQPEDAGTKEGVKTTSRSGISKGSGNRWKGGDPGRV